MENDVKVLLAAEIGPQVDDMQEFLDGLDQEAQHFLLGVIQGARFMQSLMTSKIVEDQNGA